MSPDIKRRRLGIAARVCAGIAAALLCLHVYWHLAIRKAISQGQWGAVLAYDLLVAVDAVFAVFVVAAIVLWRMRGKEVS